MSRKNKKNKIVKCKFIRFRVAFDLRCIQVELHHRKKTMNFINVNLFLFVFKYL
jgi:hypothetical protein